MTPPHRNRRLITLAVAAILVGGAAALALSSLQENISYFMTPSDLAAEGQAGERVRLGGFVEEGSVRYGDGADVTFRVTDGDETVDVIYSGALPDLFREGQGVIADGRIESARKLRAERVLAKHDENYEPIELKAVKSATR
ncbi:cytochrome c maturation protein CcmE [Euryhalocaulis caribicus]|uniref:cytochrome c maturation protein CcmE n=1 Tax=Euryhalocaulis caribicus TaxID=1161401 RepID=UPI00039E7643|nr:cytochrome c maturation protein CcmE [Euryhalocaulis caribicus]